MFKKFVLKPKPKPKTQFGGVAWGPWAQAPPNWVLGFGSGFGTNFFDKKSYTKVSDKFLSLSSAGAHAEKDTNSDRPLSFQPNGFLGFAKMYLELLGLLLELLLQLLLPLLLLPPILLPYVQL